MGSDRKGTEDHRPERGRDTPGGDRSHPVTLDAGELVRLLLEMGHATTGGELGVYRHDELDRVQESAYAQGWQDAVRHAAQQNAADPAGTALAEVVALPESPLPAARASDVRAREPLMPHRKRTGDDQRSG